MRRDLVVVGGGPAGLVAAIEAARQGMSVALFERRPMPVDKACGEGLMPSAVGLLGELGVAVPVRRAFLGIRYVDGRDPERFAEGRFADGVGWGVRRTVLAAALHDRADRLGVERIERRAEVRIADDHVDVGGIRARWCVAADGLRSPIRDQLGLTDPGWSRRWPRRYGVRRHVAIAPWSEHVEVWWADGAEAYVTPVAEDTVGVAILFGDRARAGDGPVWDRLLRRFPGLAERLADRPLVSRPQGAGPFAVRARRCVAGRVLLVGDAAGYLDPLTGEGVRLGAIGAVAAIDAIREGRPARYERAWRAQFGRYARATGMLLRVTGIGLIRRNLVGILRRAPWVMEGALGYLGG